MAIQKRALKEAKEVNDAKSAADVRANQLVAERNKLLKEGNNLAEKAVQHAKDNADNIKKQSSFTSSLLGEDEKRVILQQVMTKEGIIRAGVTKEQLRLAIEGAKAIDDQAEAIKETIPGIINFADKAAAAKKSFSLLAKTPLGILGIIIAIASALANVVKEVTETRKELGVSAFEAAKITAQTKALGFAAKAYGLDVEDIKSAQAAIRNDLGASVQESVNLSLSFARTAAATGQTAEQLTGTLSIMESISSASRDVLLNQIKTNAAIIGQAGISPALVMRDLAENAGFFAQFAKDGGSNIIGAGIAARKLGLEMSDIAGMTESLLDFESSIEAQLEASMLLGRQINMDKARQLAFTGDIEGMQQEILKQVGGEAEFAEMNYLQRKKLAAAAGTTVENLARMVRNNTAGGAAGAVGAAVAGSTNVYSDPTTHEFLRKIVRNTD